MKNKKIFNIPIFCILLFLFGCSESNSTSNAPMQYEDYTTSIEESEKTASIEEIEPIHENEVTDEETEQWKDRIYVTADELQGNILGYSLLRMAPFPENNMYYEQDMPYLLNEDIVGNGIYVSDYMCEIEVFLGDILKEVLTCRGVLNDENRQYFTEYALEQLEDTDWGSLEEGWEPDPYVYDREYCMNPISGGSGYQFLYYFFPDREETAKEEINIVDITLYVDSDGKICEIETDIDMVPTEESRIEKWIIMDGLYDDTYCEQVIRNGSLCKEEMVWDFERYFRRFMDYGEVYEQDNEGLLESGSVCTSAENLADIFLHVMGNRGMDVEKYAEWFAYDKDFLEFADTDWELLGEDWIADEEYDSFFIDQIYFYGYAKFRFYFYPDFKTMGVDTAKEVVIDCNVDVYRGLLSYVRADVFPITEEAYQAMKQHQAEGRIPVVEKGAALLETTKTAIPVIDRQLNFMPVSEFAFDTVAVQHSSRKVIEEIWGFTDAAEVSDYLGKKFLQDFDEDNVQKGEINKLIKDKDALYSALFAIEQFMDDGWKTDKQYDCYYIKSNEAAGCMHLQYYFYPERASEELTKDRTLVIDVYLSEAGIEYMGVNEFCTE